MLQWLLRNKCQGNHRSCKVVGSCVRRRVKTQLAIISILLRVWKWKCQSTDVDVRVKRVPSITPVSGNYRLAHQRGFGDVRRTCPAQWPQMVRIECFWVPRRLSGQWWKEWHMVRLGFYHVDSLVEAYVGRHVEEGPHRSDYWWVMQIRQEHAVIWKFYESLISL